jgi:MarR family transcriptional regulator, lower aerobic nicotinate degradation pathway regulator
VTPPTDGAQANDLSLVDALAQLSFLVQGALAEATAGHDLSIIQTRLLGILRDREPTMNELGGYLGLDKSSITGLVDRAERRGLVRRTASARDRRAVQVSITDAGRHLGEQVALKFEQRMAAITSRLTNAERARLATLAIRLLDRA